MFKAKDTLFLFSAIFLIAMFGNCSKPSTIIGAQTDGSGVAMLKIKVAAGSIFQSLVHTATLTVSASDMLTITQNLTITDTSVEGTVAGIPAGKNRLFSLSVYDSFDMLEYQGLSIANVVADSTVKVSINVLRIAGNAVINGTIDDSSYIPLGMKFIPSSGATFKMSTNNNVTFTYNFFMDSTDVTQAKYLSIMGTNPSNFTGDLKRPVEMVSWYDAVRFCINISKQEGLQQCYDTSNWVCDITKHGYRLPTEAEWEFACRGGTTGGYFWGNDTSAVTLNQYMWYSINDSSMTHEVALKKPNPFGLYDIYGNVWEWCYDWYTDAPLTAVTDPTGPSTGTYRVKRGVGWFGNIIPSSTQRGTNIPTTKDAAVGFRCVRTK